MSIAQRHPSINWEPLPIDSTSKFHAWVWYRPQAIPNGLTVLIPTSLFAQPELRSSLNMRHLVLAAGLDPAQIHCWTIAGVSFEGANGMSPYLDHQIPQPIPGVQVNGVEIPVWMFVDQPPGWPGVMPFASQPLSYPYAQTAIVGGSGSELDQQLLAAIDSSWNSILQLEARVSSIRKELGSAVSRLNSLNRDLNIDERRACDSKDVQDWSDARRWLRDSLSTLSRSVKEIDVGTTSGAGQHHKFEELYRTKIMPKIPWPGLSQSVIDFEAYRKTMQNLIASAQGNLSKAGRDAEQRANSVLQRISAKVRAMRRK